MGLNDLPINWSEFYKTYTGIKFTIKKDDCQIFLPNYANILHSHTLRTSGGETETLATSSTAMSFQDEYSSKAFLFTGDPQRLNKVFLKDLWEYPENNVSWDEFNEILSFKDIEVEETNLVDFAKEVDDFLIIQKLEKFGDVWWVASVKSSMEGDETAFANVEVANTSGDGTEPTEIIKFWSPDKHVNDEFKKFVSDPSSYVGFLTSDDFERGGWFSIPDLQIPSKPFEKLKIADFLLNLNFTFDPDPYFGNFYSVDSTIGARMKDSTSQEVLDCSQNKGANNSGTFSDTLISNWVGGLVGTEDIDQIGRVGSFDGENNDENNLSHIFDSQITLKPDYTSDKRDFLGTIDSINWKSANTTQTENPHSIGALNVDRAFGGASGNIENGLIVGGINTDDDGVAKVLDSSEVWKTDTFIKNLLVTTNTPRCFHIQGGTGSSSCAIVGGYGSMNTEDVQQFSDYGKSNVLDSMEYYIQTEEPELSFFRTISDYSMLIARGEAAGTLEVTTNTRRDKFDVEDIIGSYNLTPDDDQKILEFVDDASTNIINNVPVPSNFRRYNVTNVEGFIVAGNTTGNVFLLGSPTNNDIIDNFETINTTHVDVSQNVAVSTTLEEEVAQSIEDVLENVIVDVAESTVEDVVTVAGNNETGQEVTLPDCGKYRLEYINGAFQLEGAFKDEIIDSVISVDASDSNGETVNLPYCGKYRLEHLEGSYTVSGTSSSGLVSTTFNVFGDQESGTAINVDKCGIYEFEITDGAIEYTDPESGPFDTEDWFSAIEVRLNGGGWSSVVAGVSGSTTEEDAFKQVEGKTGTFCATGLIEDSNGNPDLSSNVLEVRFDETPVGGSNFANNDHFMTVRISYLGPTGGCPGCGSTALNVEINNVSEGTAFDGNKDDFEFCVPYFNSDLKLFVDSGTDGHINTRLTYLGPEDCDCGAAPNSEYIYNSHVNVYVNEQFDGTAFDSGFQDSTQDVELFNQGRPTRLIHDFCSTEPNSVVRIAPLDENDNEFTNNEGHVNIRVLFLGVADCNCDSANDDSTSTTTVVDDEQLEQTIIHSTSDPTKAYPVRCHGLYYVGNKNAGLATGGRTEYNKIDNVECRLREKYGLIGNNSCDDPTSSNPLEQNRVLDLAYEFNGSAWVRKQNLFESVYYHTGVGDETHAIFWGGLHDTISEFSFDFNVNATDPETIPVSAFDCDDVKNVSEEDSDDFGVNFTSISEIESGPCWFTPTWQSPSLSGFGLLDDPRFQPGEGTLAHALDPDFPDVFVASVGPTNPTTVTSQNVSAANFEVLSPSRLQVDKTFDPGEAEFTAKGFILNDNGTLSSNEINGTFFIKEINELEISSTEEDFYPTANYGASGTSSSSSEFTIEMTDIKVSSGGEVVLFYSLNHTGPSGFVFKGFGRILFDSMQEMWLDLKNGDGKLVASNNVFTVQESSVITDNGGGVGINIEGSATLTFGIDPDTSIIVGVNNLDQEWNTQSSQCGPDISDFISLNVNIDPNNKQRWGLPMWVGGVIEEVPDLFTLTYEFTTSTENISGDVGTIEHENTVINMGASNISAILNDRVLLSGETKRQNHTFTAVGSASLSGVSGTPDCSSVTASTSSASGTSAADTTYAEWGTAFIQEFRSDERFKLPEKFIPSNGPAIQGNNESLAFESSVWKRFMDGVGLGGDAPDYSTIVDLNNKKMPVNEWKTLNSFYIGQMAFGNTDRAIVVGGHRISPDLQSVGLHASPTSKRLFVWDFANIPPEDTYLRNYLGRRFWSYYVNDDGLLIPTQTQSSFNVKIFEAESTIVIERIGTAYFNGSEDNIDVEFDKIMPEGVDTDYSISLQPSDNINVWWSDKSNSGFTVNAETDTWVGSVDYVASSTLKVTKEDINNLGPLEGFEFDK